MKNATITLATDAVHDDEPCFFLTEGERNTDIPGGGVRRVQIITVIRDDAKWKCVVDLGPAEDFEAEPFGLQGYVEVAPGRFEVLETVGRLRLAAREMRSAKPHERPYDPQDLRAGLEETASRRLDARLGRRRFAI